MACPLIELCVTKKAQLKRPDPIQFFVGWCLQSPYDNQNTD